MSAEPERVVLIGEVGWYVPTGQDWCPRCGDTDFAEDTRICHTCTIREDVRRQVVTELHRFLSEAT